MDSTQIDSEPRYVPIDETMADDPNSQIQIWDEQQSREVGYESELEFRNVKVTIDKLIIAHFV